jgi:hypothetical protein
MQDGFLKKRRQVGLRDIAWVFLAPRRLFSKVENVAGYGWPLIVLLTAVTVVGFAKMQTGLIDREIDRQVQESIAKLDLEQANVVERSEIRKQIEELQKTGDFQKFLVRLGSVGLEPIKMLASVLLLAALFYGLVALSGKKPEWHTLLTITIYGAFIDIARMVFQLVLMVRYGKLEVDTSAAAWVRTMPMPSLDEGMQKFQDAVPTIASGVDPFRLWFWLVVLIGLSVTSQLRGWRALVPCFLFWVIAAIARTGMVVAMLQNVGGQAG